MQGMYDLFSQKISCTRVECVCCVFAQINLLPFFLFLQMINKAFINVM